MGHSYGVLMTINLLNVFTLLGEIQLEEFGVLIKEPTLLYFVVMNYCNSICIPRI